MEKRELTQRQQRTIAIICMALALVLCILACVFVGIPVIRFLKTPENFRAWVESHGFWGKAAFVAFEVFKVLVIFIPGEPLEIAAGYAFGVWEGTLLCMIGITIGSMIVFVLVRKHGMSLVRIFFTQEKIDSLRFLKASKKRDIILSNIYKIPGTPKDLINYYAGLTGIKIHVWFWICSVGRIPSIITSTISGEAFMQKQYLFGILFAVAMAGLGLLGLFFYNRFLAKKKEAGEEETKLPD
ncbi:MAG: TVP38/TMEM64 family protein [Spirochaetales bacterium]|nr:TVP38/TMEM64 family protein [Spirochaetales bacterium]